MTTQTDPDERIISGIRRRIERLESDLDARGLPASWPSTMKVAKASRMRPNRLLRAAALIIVVVAGVLIATRLTLRPTSVSVGSASPMRETDRIALPGAVYDIVFDRGRAALWFAYMSGNPEDALYRYDVASGLLSHWALPPTDHNGFLERVSVAPDGSIWVTEDYSVVRFDPATSRLTSHTFEEADPDAAPSALDPTALSPGTWPAAIAFDSQGNALISRHNVSSLTRLDAALNVVGRVSLPSNMLGPGDLLDVDGLIYAAQYAGNGDAIAFSESGEVKSDVGPGVVRFSSVAGRVVSIGVSGVAAVNPEGSAPIGGSPEGSVADRVVATNDGAVTYRDGAGTFEAISAEGTVRAALTLKTVPVEVTNPLGEPVKGFERAQVGGLASDADGSVWYLDVSTSALVHLQY